jgi:O-antigen ligase
MAQVYQKRIRMRYAALLALLASLIMVGLIFFGPNIILLRLTSNDQGSAQSRITLAQTALEIIKDHPLLGVGLNNYISAMHQYGQIDLRNNGPTLVHNVYLLITAETGLLGGAAFVLLLAFVLINCWRVFIKSKDDTISAISIGLFSGVIALAVHALSDYAIFADSRVKTQFWLLIAIVAAIVKIQENTELKAGHSFNSGPG